MLVTEAKNVPAEEKEAVLDWLETMDRQGLSMSLAEMERLLEEAPPAACQTEEYHYLRGFYDGRFLNEELGCSKK